jgi:putative ABC transport system permease protein
MMEFTYVFISVMLLFGVALAFAIVFNTLSINLIERTREIAALRTLGFAQLQIALMTTIENLLMGALGVLLGVPLGRLLCLWLVKTYQSETVTLQAVIYPRTYVLTVVGMLLLVVLAQLPSLRMMYHLDLAKATKERSG